VVRGLVGKVSAVELAEEAGGYLFCSTRRSTPVSRQSVQEARHATDFFGDRVMIHEEVKARVISSFTHSGAPAGVTRFEWLLEGENHG